MTRMSKFESIQDYRRHNKTDKNRQSLRSLGRSCEWTELVKFYFRLLTPLKHAVQLH